MKLFSQNEQAIENKNITVPYHYFSLIFVFLLIPYSMYFMFEMEIHKSSVYNKDIWKEDEKSFYFAYYLFFYLIFVNFISLTFSKNLSKKYSLGVFYDYTHFILICYFIGIFFAARYIKYNDFMFIFSNTLTLFLISVYAYKMFIIKTEEKNNPNILKIVSSINILIILFISLYILPNLRLY